MNYDCPICHKLLVFTEIKPIPILVFNCDKCDLIIYIAANNSVVQYRKFSQSQYCAWRIYSDYHSNNFQYNNSYFMFFYPDFSDLQKINDKIQIIKIFQ